MLVRHGDILVESVDSIPLACKKLNHLVLAEGELTGHSHRISEQGAATLFQSTDDSLASTLYLRVTKSAATLVHQEHGPISLPSGDYRVWRQREYSPQEVRTVRD